MYKRLIEGQIKDRFFQGKVIILTGARQTGKTTLALKIVKNLGLEDNVKIFNCDNPTDRKSLDNKDLDFLKGITGDAKVIFIDEGQKVESIGQTLKLLVDYYQNKKQILVTGSSSFNLLDKTQEALTGRKFVFNLFPLSLEEMFGGKDQLAISKNLEALLIYGNYPEIAGQVSFENKEDLLKELTSSYLYNDILEFQQIRNSAVISDLLKALAFQIGNEVSYTELAKLLGIDKNTVERYVQLLEKNYIIFRLSPYATNKRKEISKLRKVYFYDIGIRNAIINNFNFLNNRDDAGALWENFILVERIKFQNYHKIYANNYFWRTYDGAEVDLVEERNGKLFGYEFKWSDKKRKKSAPGLWKKYRESSYKVITPGNMDDFVF